MTSLVRREVMSVKEQRWYQALGRSTAPWYTRWILWVYQVGGYEED